MEKAPGGTSVGVDDPYAHVDRCDFVTDEGRCRWARDHGRRDPAFADRLSADDFRCPVVAAADGDPDGADWATCPHFRCRNHARECARCGIAERRVANDEDRPLLEEHHLSYADGPATDADGPGASVAEGADANADAMGDGTSATGDPDHEITVYLCRWCHAKVHGSWARVDDDASPDPEAIAEREGRRSREQAELGFESAAERFDREEGPDGGDGP